MAAAVTAIPRFPSSLPRCLLPSQPQQTNRPTLIPRCNGRSTSFPRTSARFSPHPVQQTEGNGGSNPNGALFSPGEALFQTHENLEHLAMMERVLGPLPQHMVNRADQRAGKYFKRSMRLDWPEGATSRESIRAVWKLQRLQNLVMQHVDYSAGDLIDLLQGLLRYDPAERLKAREALQHPFFTRDFRRSGY